MSAERTLFLLSLLSQARKKLFYFCVKSLGFISFFFAGSERIFYVSFKIQHWLGQRAHILSFILSFIHLFELKKIVCADVTIHHTGEQFRILITLRGKKDKLDSCNSVSKNSLIRWKWNHNYLHGSIGLRYSGKVLRGRVREAYTCF